MVEPFGRRQEIAGVEGWEAAWGCEFCAVGAGGIWGGAFEPSSTSESPTSCSFFRS